jgi:hypothetical protein
MERIYAVLAGRETCRLEAGVPNGNGNGNGNGKGKGKGKGDGNPCRLEAGVPDFALSALLLS